MTFTYRHSSMTGCEILDADGNVFTWSIDPASAAMGCGPVEVIGTTTGEEKDFYFFDPHSYIL